MPITGEVFYVINLNKLVKEIYDNNLSSLIQTLQFGGDDDHFINGFLIDENSNVTQISGNYINLEQFIGKTGVIFSRPIA